MPDLRLERLLAVLLVAAVLLNYPVLALVERLAESVGSPLVPLYLFGAWALVIAAAAWLVESRGGD